MRRLLHHAVVVQIEGASYRLRQHADLVPEHIRSKALIHPPAQTPPPKRRGRERIRLRSKLPAKMEIRAARSSKSQRPRRPFASSRFPCCPSTVRPSLSPPPADLVDPSALFR